MEQQFITQMARASLLEQQGALRLELGRPGRAVTLTARDGLDGAEWFRTANNWQTESSGDLCRARFVANAPGGCGEYELYAQEGVAALAVLTRFRFEPGADIEKPLHWLNFAVEGAHRVHTLHPTFTAPIVELAVPTSFRQDMELETEQGVVGFFYSGEPCYDPKNKIARPDMWVETTGIQPFAPLRTAVIAWGETPADAQKAAQTLHEALELHLAPAPCPAVGDEHAFENGQLRFVLNRTPQGVWLSSIHTLSATPAALSLPLVRLRLRELKTGCEYTVDSASGWQSTQVFRGNGGGRVCLTGREGWSELTVELSFQFTAPSRVEWDTHILNGEQQLSVLWATYAPGPWNGRQVSCFVPEHSGWVAENVTDIHFYRDGIYPRGWRFTMGYFAAYTAREKGRCNGFYWGIHDEAGAFKTITAETDPIAQTGLFSARLHAPGYGMGGNAFRLPGPLVWQLFEGDWYDATLIYKDFVHTRAHWLPEVGPEGREDTPLWAKELPLWVMDWMPNTNPLAEPIPTSITKGKGEVPMEYWYEEPIKLQQELGVPIGYHVYNWHWIPFNNDYPHYLPPKKEFVEGLSRLRQSNVRIMPYINARLWDTHDKEGGDWQFGSLAKAWATKPASGVPFIERYESHEPNGELCELAIMCPSSGVWKAKMAEVLRGLFQDVGVDGVYMDQIAAAAPYLCEDPGHNHLPGGGSWWAEQYNLMMRRNRQVRGENGILTTEDNAEVYAKCMDGFLTWVWTFDNLVPAFSVIYAGHVMMLGRTTNGLKKGDNIFLKYETAEQLLFGGQLGWLNADVVERPAELGFLKKMTLLRYKFSPFFYKGSPLRPARLQSDRPVKLTSPTYFDSRLFEARQVLTGTWRLWNGEKTLAFFINCDTVPANFTAQLGAGSATLLEGEGCLSQARAEDGELMLTGTIEPEGYLVVELQEVSYDA